MNSTLTLTQLQRLCELSFNRANVLQEVEALLGPVTLGGVPVTRFWLEKTGQVFLSSHPDFAPFFYPSDNGSVLSFLSEVWSDLSFQMNGAGMIQVMHEIRDEGWHDLMTVDQFQNTKEISLSLFGATREQQSQKLSWMYSNWKALNNAREMLDEELEKFMERRQAQIDTMAKLRQELYART